MNVRRLTPAFVVVLAALAACENGPATPEAAPTPAGCATPAAGTAKVEVIPGPTNGVPAASAPGAPLVIEAAVLDAACQPAAGANVRIWHTDATGLYGPGTDQCCYYAGTVATDDAGRFRMRTIRPAHYPVPNAPPAHIHLEISHRGEPLETEIIFRDEPPPSMASPTGQALPIVLRPDGAGWRGEALFVLHRPDRVEARAALAHSRRGPPLPTTHRGVLRVERAARGPGPAHGGSWPRDLATNVS